MPPRFHIPRRTHTRPRLPPRALNPRVSEGNKNLVGRNKALVHVVAKDYAAAVREYEECIERDSSDVVAVNNKALCLMYLRDLSDAIKVMESALERVPTAALNESLVVNLCSMYELAYVNHTDAKRTLNTWITRVAPDDFDSSCTRM
ncbi:PREDICTED: trafficking protein particle complex subunit 12 isoform X2 [Brassica oleracea var. oleracea]|uniref:trafficking protein particle complex subunit 12 isoform X2 n=1 Tax=Brassica oleracea var. oleracea TaxID=109376 RepID=UPI0006A6CE20|nr:PREDICTED: trafficking protein particle complex subunit 12 isoform X2 [Brassica oleracea var. oleracea]